MEIDLLKIQFLDSKEFEIKNPITQKGEGAFLTIASMTSKIGKQVQMEIYRKALELRKDDTEPTEEEFREATKDIMSKLIIGWRGLNKNGKPFKYSEKNAIELMKNGTIIYEMVNLNAGFAANFIKE